MKAEIKMLKRRMEGKLVKNSVGSGCKQYCPFPIYI
jgi:hypothetical protein